MNRTHEITNLHQEIVRDYKNYITSFINIKDHRIRQFIEDEITSGKYWPEPLIQFNPSYRQFGSANKLCDLGVLHREISNIFKGYDLFQHQKEALEMGASGKSYILTSGTGSGKSLTFLGTIFNYILSHSSSAEVKAIIVYPMNALINSQYESLQTYEKDYTVLTGKQFPITYAKYTGQEKDDERQRILENVPDILLTNYMMLELILTRSRERKLRQSIFNNLKILVFDELHTYRGRQGADISMLIRRIHAQCKNDLQCIGTSATMMSGTSNSDQKKTIADVASLIFGQSFTESQVIQESLERCFKNSREDLNELKKSLSSEISLSNSPDSLMKHPLSFWIENEVAIQDNNGTLTRRSPATFIEIANKLSGHSGMDQKTCAARLDEYLQWLGLINSNFINKKQSFLPFRLHQFISQTGSIFITLEDPNIRDITLEPMPFTHGDEPKPLYPIVFSRLSGHEFICVHLESANWTLEPREFRESFEDEDIFSNGYIIPGGNEIWDPQNDFPELPDSWYRFDKNGNIKVDSKYSERIPKKIYYDSQGNFSWEPIYNSEGWYMPTKLLFDPTAGTIYDLKTNESTKLSRLGSEGRSTSTTTLTVSVIKTLGYFGFSYADQKILSFSDNRQDAALQSGHFNDFVMIVRFRSALYHALNKYKKLTHANIANAIFESLSLNPTEYLENPSPFPSSKQQQEEIFKSYLFYLVVEDLRRSWRFVLPNLEHCALLKLSYAFLEENCTISELWKDIPFIDKLNPEKRQDVIFQVLEYFRKAYALHSENYLNPNKISEYTKEIREKLKNPWTLDNNEKISVPSVMRYVQLHRHSNFFSSSIGFQSALGRYLRREADTVGVSFSKSEYQGFIKAILDRLVDAGWLKSSDAKDNNNKPTSVYQLKIDAIIWRLGDERTVIDDPVKQIKYKEVSLKPNPYFLNLYKSDFTSIRTMTAREHTGQVSNDERIDIENLFREGNISTLFCSPTMELGIDIKTLNVVHMRNVPPNPSNYTQRSGRAGRSGQTSLVFAYCSAYSPHDRHYFDHRLEMVSGVVLPPKIDLRNEELLVSHLYAVYLSQIGLDEIDESIFNVLDDTQAETLPLKNSVKEKLIISPAIKREILDIYKNILAQLPIKKSNTGTNIDEQWIGIQIDQAAHKFDKALDRWRKLYLSAKSQLKAATDIISSLQYPSNSPEMKDAKRNQTQANQQIDILLNRIKKNSLSEFYPYRYLAAEGFLPGYNFTRLPMRTWIPKGDSGEYISRSRFIALREFGPGNIVYHCGSKYKINQMTISDPEEKLTSAKVCKSSGYWMQGEEYHNETCPITGDTLLSNESRFTDLLEMYDTRTERMMKISCDEEERLSRGYAIDTYFSTPAGADTVKKARITNESDDFIFIRYIPVASLVQLNKKWRTSHEDGFLMGMRSGIWKKQSVLDNPVQTEEHRRVQLYTTEITDALYIQPTKPLNLQTDGILTLQYALKRAIENIFQVEQQEIGSTLIGNPEQPNILIYESSEGSLGVLSQFMDDQSLFQKVVIEAIKICRFNDLEYTDPASYDDLLSYYNQRDHKKINRFLIKDALEKLKICRYEIISNTAFQDYDEHYRHLLKSIDPQSETELRFLKYLYKSNIRLPDKAQMRVEGIYSQPDFFYEPNIHVFCDGIPHDDPTLKEHDEKIRQAIRNHGEQVIVYYYKDNLDEVIDRRSDIFKKVR
jgi:superfamily II DNA/RNA helicase